jgi:beta-lactamase regulating signal transducer with metallopeptidase domain
VKTLLDIGLANAVMASVLALLAAVVCRFCRKPALAHALWLLVLLKLIVPPLWKVPVSDSFSHLFPQSSAPAMERVAVPPEAEPAHADPTSHPPAAHKAVAPTPLLVESGALPSITGPIASRHASGIDASSPLATADVEPLLDPITEPLVPSSEIWRPGPAIQPWHPPLPSMTSALVGFWAGGSCVCTFIIIGRLLRFQRLLSYAVPATHSAQRRADSLARRMGTSAPGVWFIPGTVCPMLYALGRKPRLLIPEALWDRLDDNQQSALLVHELAHLRRGDHRVRMLELLVTILYWWNPVAWWARRELREAEEQCCDAWVVWLMPGSARHYASALLEAVEFVSQDGDHKNIRPRPAVPLLASGMGEFHRLRRRLIMIKTMRVTRKLTGFGMTSMLGLAGLLLPMAPTWAQQATPASVPPPKPEASQSEVSGTFGINQGPARPDAAQQERGQTDERAVIEQLRAQSAALEAQAQSHAAAARQVAEMYTRDVARKQVDQQLQQARAEVQKLSASLAQATARLKALEIETGRMSAMPANYGGKGIAMEGMSANKNINNWTAAKAGSAGVETPSGRINVTVTTPPTVTFTPNGGTAGGMNLPPGTTVMRMTPDGKIIEKYNGPEIPTSGLEQRIANLDAQLQMLRTEVQQIRRDMHSGKPGSPRSEGQSPEPKPMTSSQGR